ncbi:Hsp20/alpha crystallin family protein [Thalassovita aquimarina]|uniref:Hsp20/alpha crystallin family protein n=1 Tax=Thalassovita aquimarina TaxID=2785917 RepID=A0ABS5HW90_9RHOB|nr:Hsp20/alpha crystallin family protein [Thalassovita aquimarina]MBR9653265.1 Hsp20/alpha crystallin family protein [Thalassovita aquimarina]
MAHRSWLPSAWLGSKGEEHPFAALREQIDTIFDDFDKGILNREGGFAIRSNVSETDKDVCITAELPGITEKDVDVSITGNRITIKGEKKTEEEEKGEEENRTFRRIERYSGSFERMMTLPFDIDPDTVAAEVKDGVLTVTIPKPPEEVTGTRKVEVKKAK